MASAKKDIDEVAMVSLNVKFDQTAKLEPSKMMRSNRNAGARCSNCSAGARRGGSGVKPQEPESFRKESNCRRAGQDQTAQGSKYANTATIVKHEGAS